MASRRSRKPSLSKALLVHCSTKGKIMVLRGKCIAAMRNFRLHSLRIGA
jgi:hypothetical protein